MSYICLWSSAWNTGVPTDASFLSDLFIHAPSIHLGARGRIWADARGMDAPALARALLAATRERGIDGVRAGIATTPITADVAATWDPDHHLIVERAAVIEHDAHSGALITIVEPDRDRDFLAGFPLSVLDPDPKLAVFFDGLGLERCGDLAQLDAQSIEFRIGAEGVRLWRLARADDGRTLFRAAARALPAASLAWTEYTVRESGTLIFVINSLITKVCTTLAARGERARSLSLLFSLAALPTSLHPLRSGRPSADPARWARLARRALETITLPAGVTGVEIRVDALTDNAGIQGDLFDRGFASAAAVEQALAALVEQDPDILVTPRTSRDPLVERRAKWVAESPASGEYAARRRADDPRANAAPSLSLQLVAAPEAISVELAPRRDHEIPVRYRDRTGWHALLQVAGPDAISGGIGSGAYAREYFRCVRDDGVMVWLYRTGRKTPHWFFQGWWD